MYLHDEGHPCHPPNNLLLFDSEGEERREVGESWVVVLSHSS